MEVLLTIDITVNHEILNSLCFGITDFITIYTATQSLGNLQLVLAPVHNN